MAFFPTFILVAIAVLSSDGFVPSSCSATFTLVSTVCHARKISMKEKRKRRQSRQQRKITMEGPPVILSSSPSEPALDTVDEPQQQRAKELLAAQRDSVKALTEMRESLDRHLNGTDVRDHLEKHGYASVDNFLGDEDLVETLLTEAVALYSDDGATSSSNFTRDLVQLGCSVAPLEGGSEQYFQSPRCIEWVVALTKHCASVLGYEDRIDKRKTQGQLRVFDRNARMAALDLLKADDDDEPGDDNEKMQTIVQDVQSDLRRLSVMLFLMDADWSLDGGFKFGDGVEILAQRNRLVLINSTDTHFASRPWRGNEGKRFAAVLQVHLIQHQP